MPVSAVIPKLNEQADAAQDDESLSAYPGQAIAAHGRETGRWPAKSRQPCQGTCRPVRSRGRWQTWEKFSAVSGSLSPPTGQREAILPRHRKKPGYLSTNSIRWITAGAAVAIAMNSPVLWHCLPSCNAMRLTIRPCLALGASCSIKLACRRTNPHHPRRHPIRWSRDTCSRYNRFNLLAYLICTHHGKVRLAWHACPADHAAADELPRIRGIRDGDTLPPLVLCAADCTLHQLPETLLDLAPAAAGLNPRTGAGWTERVLSLLDCHGPFALAWLEALLRAADQRASRMPNVRDELLFPEVKP